MVYDIQNTIFVTLELEKTQFKTVFKRFLGFSPWN